MKKILLLILCSSALYIAKSQNVSIRAVQTAYNTADPDGAGPATGSVTITFEMMSAGPFQFIGLGVGLAFQSERLIPTVPASPVTPLGPLAGANWNISPNLTGNVASLNDGGQLYDRRMIIGFNQGPNPSLPVPTTWTPICSVNYWVTGSSFPQGGYFVIEPGALVPTHAITDDSFEDHPYLSGTYPTANPLGGALPVLFSQFDAKCSGNGTLISWATAQEANSDYFEVQRSTDGTAWKTIGRSPAAGNSGTSRSYNQLDLEAGNALYRIKQVDKDGQAIYTNIERANCEVKNISSVIYPVPAKDVLNVVIKSDRAVRTQLMVFEISGKLVKKLDANVQNGTNNFRIDLKGLISGDYIIKSSDSGIELNKQFSIIR